MGNGASMNLTELSKTELKQYLSQNRNDDEKFSAALEELMRRNSDAPVYPPMGWEETKKIIDDKIRQVNSEN